jgi:5-methylcytosine-specific restriction endonuclease McrA
MNATYAELSPTGVKRAIALVLRGDAVISEVHPEGRVVRAQGLDFPWPLVIRLLTAIKVPFHIAPAHYSKAGVRARDNNTCAYCGKHGDTVDHILPQAQGGPDSWENTVCACTRCNGEKGNHTAVEYAEWAANQLKPKDRTLKIEPTVPLRMYLTGGKRKRKA